MSGDSLWTRATNSATAFAGCSVLVGLFGLQKKTRPAHFAACAIPSSSSRPSLPTGTLRTPTPSCSAIFSGFSKEGAAVTRWRDDEVNRRTDVRRISHDPAPRAMFSGATETRFAIAARRSVIDGRALLGYRPASTNARVSASMTAGPGPSGFSLLSSRIGEAVSGDAFVPPAVAASRPLAATSTGERAAVPGLRAPRKERRETGMAVLLAARCGPILPDRLAHGEGNRTNAPGPVQRPRRCRSAKAR